MPTNTSILAIDTSSSNSYVSLLKDGQFYTESISGENSHNEEIDNLVKSAVRKAGVTFDQISALVLGSGPGSFTGLRIAYAYIKGLALALKAPVFQYSSLQACAYSYAEENISGVICSISDARRGEYFSVIQKIENNKVELLHEADILIPQEIVRKLAACNANTYMVNCGGVLPGELTEFSTLALPPLSESLLKMHGSMSSQHKSKKPFKLQEIADFEPFYLRAVAAKTLKDRGIET